jgi:hypothetical protein
MQQTKKECRGCSVQEAEILVGSSERAFPFWCLAVWHKNYSILPVHVFSADPIEFHLLRFVRVFSKFVLRDWHSDDARRFQSVDEIMIPLSIQLLALNAPLLSIR